MSPELTRALVRLVRGFVAVGVGAGISWLATALVQEPAIDPAVAVMLAPILMAVGKYMREKGWITLPV